MSLHSNTHLSNNDNFIHIVLPNDKKKMLCSNLWHMFCVILFVFYNRFKFTSYAAEEGFKWRKSICRLFTSINRTSPYCKMKTTNGLEKLVPENMSKKVMQAKAIKNAKSSENFVESITVTNCVWKVSQ